LLRYAAMRYDGNVFSRVLLSILTCGDWCMLRHSLEPASHRRPDARLQIAFVLLVGFCLFGLRLSAQAPIERQPPPPSAASAPAPPGPPIAWQVFETRSRDFIGSEVTVRGTPFNARCILDDVRPDGLSCHQEFRPSPFLPGGLPARDIDFDRTDVKTVWKPDRAASCFLGIGFGFSLGAGMAAANSSNENASDETTRILLAGGAIGALVGYIGYKAPLIHHVLYRAR
jgi:hypothetical protein